MYWDRGDYTDPCAMDFITGPRRNNMPLVVINAKWSSLATMSQIKNGPYASLLSA